MVKKQKAPVHPKERRKPNTTYFHGTTQFGIADLELMAHELADWAEKDTSIRIFDFPADRNMHPTQFLRFVQMNENLLHAYKVALYKIGARREERMNAGKMDRAVYASVAGAYDPMIRSWSKYKAKISKTEAQQPTTIKVVCEKFESVGKVPDIRPAGAPDPEDEDY